MRTGPFDPLDEEFFKEGDRIGTEAPEDFSDLDVAMGSTAALRLPLRAPAERVARPTLQWRTWVHDHAAAIGVAGIVLVLAIGLIAALVRGGGASTLAGPRLSPSPISAAIAAPVAGSESRPMAAAAAAVEAAAVEVAAIETAPAAAPAAKSDRASRPRLTPAQRRARAEALYAKGRDASIDGHYKTAASFFKRAILADASFATSHRALGLVYRELGDRKRAASSFRTYLKLAPRARDAGAIRRQIAQLTR